MSRELTKIAEHGSELERAQAGVPDLTKRMNGKSKPKKLSLFRRIWNWWKYRRWMRQISTEKAISSLDETRKLMQKILEIQTKGYYHSIDQSEHRKPTVASRCLLAVSYKQSDPVESHFLINVNNIHMVERVDDTRTRIRFIQGTPNEVVFEMPYKDVFLWLGEAGWFCN